MNDNSPTPLNRAPRRLLSKRMIPRYLFCLACLATLLALFYGVENWRGRRAWENCRRELEAKGEVLDWNAYIPAPVPDEQNVFKAPKIAEWFVKGSLAAAISDERSKSGNTNAPFSLSPPRDLYKGPVLVAEVAVIPSNGPLPPGKADAVLSFDDPAASEQAAKLLRESIGPCAEGAQNYVLLARPVDQANPLNLVLQADTVPTPKALAEFLSLSPGANKIGTPLGLSHVRVATAGSNGFRVLLTASVCSAADYLARSQPAVPDFDLVRKALERPYARMDGDYQRPFARPVPNFVSLRSAAQILSQRAQCYLLLGQPEAAWHELSLVRDTCRLLEASPPRKATTLVEAMINVAITGLYTHVIDDGLRLQAWREPELVALQKQLKDINLLPLIKEAMNAERAAVCRTFEATPSTELQKLLSFGREPQRLWERLMSPNYLAVGLMPHGWMYQNMCAIALRDQLAAELFDLPDNCVLPHKADDILSQLETTFSRFRPYTFLAAIATPNFIVASQRLARNQTLINEAYLACCLERYHLAHGQYPDTLEALLPQFAEKLPHDIIGGQSFKYRRTADGRFLLYSIGWNEKDDGGIPGKTTVDGDWVWQLPSP